MFTRGLCAIRSLDTDIADEGLKLEVFVFDWNIKAESIGLKDAYNMKRKRKEDWM
jgi:hypothetical protein